MLNYEHILEKSMVVMRAGQNKLLIENYKLPNTKAALKSEM